MAKRIGRYTIQLDNHPQVIGFGSVVGEKEGQGPLRNRFNHVYTDDTLGEKTWEKSEGKMLAAAVRFALKRASKKPENVDMVFAGDLLNQCISSSFGLKEFNIPFSGLYGACSTMAQSLALSSVFVDTGSADCTLAATASHFCTAERQYRYPLEYGGQRPPSSQWTVTGAGAVVVGKKEGANLPFISEVCFGKIVDFGINDINNMGAAMAPSAADTLQTFLTDTGTDLSTFDMIVTGDLGSIGSTLFRELLTREGIDVGSKLADCGELIFNRELQQVHSGGSGAGCSAVVICGYVLDEMVKGNLNNVLFLGTGALMSPLTVQQGDNIPAITHLIHLCV